MGDADKSWAGAKRKSSLSGSMKPGQSTRHIGRGDGSSTLEMMVYLRRTQRQYGVRKEQSAAAPHSVLVGMMATEA